MSDFGEPFVLCASGHGVLNRRWANLDSGAQARLKDCANALAGIADPAEFVERAKAMEAALAEIHAEAARCSRVQGGSPDAPYGYAKIAALTAEWTPDE